MKKGSKQYKLTLKLKTGIILLSLILTTLSLPLSAYAQISKTATLSADIKNKLKMLEEEIASKAAQLKIEVGRKMQNRVYAGFIKSKSDNTITIASDNGSKMITVNDYTQYFPAKSKIKLSSLDTDDYITALGDVDDTDVLTAKRIIKMGPPEDREIVQGTISSVGTSSVTITIEEKTRTIAVDKNTDYEYPKGQISLDNIKVSQSVVVVLTKQKDSDYARFIYLTSNSNPILAQPKTTTTSTSSSSQQKLKK